MVKADTWILLGVGAAAVIGGYFLVVKPAQDFLGGVSKTFGDISSTLSGIPNALAGLGGYVINVTTPSQQGLADYSQQQRDQAEKGQQILNTLNAQAEENKKNFSDLKSYVEHQVSLAKKGGSPLSDNVLFTSNPNAQNNPNLQSTIFPNNSTPSPNVSVQTNFPRTVQFSSGTIFQNPFYSPPTLGPNVSQSNRVSGNYSGVLAVSTPLPSQLPNTLAGITFKK